MRITLILVTMVVAAGPSALAGTTTWTGGNGDSWHQNNKWDNNAPGPNDLAIINNGTRPEIDNSAVAKAGQIQIDGSGSHVKILSGGILELGDGTSQLSQITDTGKLEVVGVLKINGAVTIEGNNGDILMSDAGAQINELTDDDDELTLEHDCDDTLIDTCSVRLRGSGRVNVKLVNNAFVYAESDTDPLELDLRSKSGTGVFEARDDGVLSVEVSVFGGEWRVTDTDGGMIQLVDDGCVVTSGATVLTGESQGDFHYVLYVAAGKSFCSTGPLNFASTGGGPTEPAIFVGSGGYARFGMIACTTCP